MFYLNVSTLTVGAEVNVPLPNVNFSIAEPTISLERLIEDSVTQQIRQLTETFEREEVTRRVNQQYLSDSDVKRMAADGKIALQEQNQTTSLFDEAVEKALAGYKKGRFKVFIEGSEVQGLETQIELTSTTDVKFLRLLPLIGG